jgi:hypothetical protein
MNFDPIETALRYVRGMTYPIEFDCDSICSNFMVNHIRYKVMDSVWMNTQACCTWSLTGALSEKIREYSFGGDI